MADVDDQVELDLSLLVDEFDATAGHLQGERARDCAIPGLQGREQAVPDDEGGYVEVEDHGQLETEGMYLDAVDQQLDGGIVGRDDPVRTELDNVLPAGYLPGLPGRLGQPLTRAQP